MDKLMNCKFTREHGQVKPDTKPPKNPDIPRKGYDPKSLMDELPIKKKHKK